jgi:DNA mismatch repair protein MutS
MGRLDEYLEYLQQSIAKYGKKTTVLYQCGMFHELYGIENQVEHQGQVSEIAGLLNIQVTRTDKSIIENSRSNPLMAGFPSVSLPRNVDLLVNSGWTVVVVDQLTPPPIVKRAITNVYSKGTVVEGIQSRDNYLVSIFIQTEKRGTNRIGLSSIDLSTGKSFIHEAISGGSCLNESCRFIQTFQPTEIIINVHGGTEFNWPEQLDITHIPHHYHIDRLETQQKISYQNDRFSKFFPNHGLLSPIEYLNLEKYQCAVVSYLALLEFCQDHNKDLLDKLHTPERWNNSQHLILDNNAIQQLNLLEVIKEVDTTSTNMGSRLLKERVLLPIIDEEELSRRYNYIETLRSAAVDRELATVIVKRDTKTPLWQIVEDHLSKVGDLERMMRRVETKIMQPAEFQKFDDCVCAVQKLFKFIESSRLAQILGKCDWREIRTFYTNVLNIAESSKYNMDDIRSSIFVHGYVKEIDELQQKISAGKDGYVNIVNYLTETFCSGTKRTKGPSINLKITDDHMYLLEMTPAKYAELQRIYKPHPEFCNYPLTDFTVVSSLKSSVKLSFPQQLVKLNERLPEFIEALGGESKRRYLEFLDLFVQKCGGSVREMCNIVAEIDVYKAGAKTSVKLNHCKPEIVSGLQSGCFDATDLRHPLIEKGVHRDPYVPHSIKMGEGEGILLYGVNKSGKSSAMKSCGVSIALAQAGFYVPAKRLRFSPYHSLMTRILSNDNIFKGLSSFAVEMSEIKTITDFNDNYSLILGDEVCHGTETESAVALVASVVSYLTKKRSNFIFATHYHQLSTLEEIVSNPKIIQCHLEVIYNEESDELIYNRVIKAGPGPATYGIEVARAMKIKPEIISLAQKIRSGRQKPRGASSYNPDVFYEECAVCGADGFDIHHIQWRASANSQGFIGDTSLHKDSARNLVCLCKEHHNMVHLPVQKELIIWGWRDRKLEYKIRDKLESLWRVQPLTQ